MASIENEIEFHPLANIFPLIEGVAFRDLVEDLRVHGLREPIFLYEGQILDGRNRYRACRAAQVPARFRTYSGRDALAFVISANLHRRHLDASQRALIAAEIAELGSAGADRKGGRRNLLTGQLMRPLKHPERSRVNSPPTAIESRKKRITPAEAGKLLGVSAPTVTQAKRVLECGVPALVRAVREGRASVSAAQELAAFPAEQQNKILASDNPRVVTTIGRALIRERLSERRVRRAAAGTTTHAVFDFLKVDGRSIGNIRVGEIARLVEDLRLVADILSAVLNHSANANHADRVRDVISEAGLSEIVRHATEQRTVA